ncbi:MAG TPA: hypothetical protein VMW16_17035 [Sedimentisphaerales bacterium]|nr:hypothetical protein [Sedimentisphaerales bacterium]
MKNPPIENTARRGASPLVLAGCLLAFFAGCENAGPPLQEQVKTLNREKTQLTRQLQQSKAETEELKKQLAALSSLRDEVKLENVYQIQRIKITNYTNFYDKDRDGKKEKLIVYIQPIDETGDIIKAAGAVDVQLWDLNKSGAEALLGQWRVAPAELKKLWFATLITINYRLTFDIAGIVKDFKEPLTVKVTFTDYLSGKVFKEQKVIKPQPK